jgi:hypothetical protein
MHAATTKENKRQGHQKGRIRVRGLTIQENLLRIQFSAIVGRRKDAAWPVNSGATRSSILMKVLSMVQSFHQKNDVWQFGIP